MTAVKPSALNCRNAPGEGCSATASFSEIRTRLIPGSFHNNDILSRHLSAWSRAEKLTTSRCFPLYLPALPSLQQTMAAARSLRPLQQKGREFVGHVEHHIMSACKLLLPPAALSCLGVNWLKGPSKPLARMYPMFAMPSQAPLICAGASKLDSGCIVH